MTFNRPRPATRPLTLLALLYGGLLLYASLMPYDFSTSQDLPYQLYQAFNHWPFNPRARISGSDTLSNLILYIPLGFLLAARLRIGRRTRPFSYWFAAVSCTALSLGVETLQLLSLARVASASDILLNSISGILGATAGAMWGDYLWQAAIAWLHERWRSRPLDILTLAFMSLLAADALAPFLPTILLSQVWRNLKHSHFSLLEGFALHPWHWWLVTRVFVYLTLTTLLATWNTAVSRHRNWGRAFFAAALFALLLELAKPLFVSRLFNFANVAASLAGAGLAVIIGPLLTDRLRPRHKLELTTLFLLVYLFYLGWMPFDFIWDPEMISKKIPSLVQLLPLYHYAMGASLNHVRLFVQNVAILGMLVYLLRVRFARLAENRYRILLAVSMAAILGIFQEGGQLFQPTRVPSATDIYCFMIGGALGAWLPINQKLLPHSTSTRLCCGKTT